MTRKVTTDLVDAIGTFMNNTNLMSDYIGDLDNLDSDFANNYADSNLVSAINYAGGLLDSIGTTLFSGTGNLYVKGFIGDSAEFKRIRVGKLIADSATIDSATIGHLYVTGSMYADSARFRNITVDSIGVEPGAILTIDSAYVNNLKVTSLSIDSATVIKLTANEADITYATIDSATITNLEVTKLIIDSDRIELDNAKLFTVKNDSGTIVLAGYFLSTNNDPTIA